MIEARKRVFTSWHEGVTRLTIFRHDEGAGLVYTLEGDPLYPAFQISPWYRTHWSMRRALILLGFRHEEPATEGDTQWVNDKPSPFSSRSTGF